MINIWRKVRRLEGYSNNFSLLTPIHENPDFVPGLRAGLVTWKNKGITVIGDMIQGSSILTFPQMKNKYDLTNNDFLKYLQVKNFILSNLKKFPGGLAISPIESLFRNDKGLKFFSKKLYKTLCNLKADNSDKIKGKWESDLGTIDPDDWNALCGQPSRVLLSNSYWERQFKILYRLFISPEARHRMNPTLSELCVKCKSATGSFIHCLWSCPYIQQFWSTIIQQFSIIFKCHLHLGARTCLLGLNEELPAGFRNRDLLDILLHCARKCIMVLWISDKAPTLTQWQQTVLSIIPFEAVSTAMKDKPFLFYRTWDPFLDYLGISASRRLRSGLLGLAWSKDVGP